MSVVTPPLLSSRDVCRTAGVTYRQLDYWWRTGILTPARPGHGSGTAHRWSEADAARVKVIKYLMVWPPAGARIATILDRASRFRGRWLVIGSEAGSTVVDDVDLARACAKFGPGCIVVDLEATTAAEERRAS